MKAIKLVLLFVGFLYMGFFTSTFSQWIEQVSGVNVSLNCVCSIYSNLGPIDGWVCGNNGTVLKTTNAGTNWINVSSGIPSDVTLTSIISPIGNNNVALTAGLNTGNAAVLFRTTNGGTSWQLVFSQPNGQIYGITESLIMIGKPMGGRWTIFRSQNEGATWDSSGLRLWQDGTETGFNNSLATSDTKIWFGTNNSRIYYTSNFLTGWLQQSTVPEINSNSIWFQYLITDATGYGLTAGNSIFKTMNLGTNWNPVATPGSGQIIGISGLAPYQYDKCWFSRGNQIYAGENGTNWYLQYTAPNGSYKNISNNKTGSDFLWAVRDNGGISKYTGMIGIHPISAEIPNQFSLSQNYPNPFNPNTKIQFALPKSTFAKLVVYDALGREMETLVSEQLNAGTYEADWSADKFSSGVYYYKLTAGDYTETKKMVLMK